LRGPARAEKRLVRAPLYQQLHELLSELLRSPEFGAGSRFLTERQVSERFGVSRPTANKVLAGLVSEGLLEFRKGVGTFVRGAVLDYDLRSLVSFTRKAEQAGLTPATKVLAFRKAGVSALPPEIAAALQLEAGARAFYMERLRLAGDTPMIYERRWVPVAQCPALTRRDVLGSIYTFWTEGAGLEIGGADQVIRAVNLDATEAELLGGRSRDAGFLVTATGWLADGRPLWTERTLYRGDAYEFHHQSRGVGRQATLVYRGRLSA
jgi:DNA-binding GntR family transcriptional regulator